MLALALFIAAGAPAAQALLVPARRVTRGSNRILSEANIEQLKLVGFGNGFSVAIEGDTVVVGGRDPVYVQSALSDGPIDIRRKTRRRYDTTPKRQRPLDDDCK